MAKKNLQIQQLNSKMKIFAASKNVVYPPTGWVKAIRTALGISAEQLSRKLSMSKQSLQELEAREKNGSVTLKSLKKVAKALDMQLVYGFIPKDGSLDALIERRAKELATKIVLRTSNT